MEDRFSFRAWFNVSYTIENCEEKERFICINDVACSKNCVAFTDYELNEAISSLELSENQEEEIMEYFQDRATAIDEYGFNIYCKDTEQCTGLKDKNGTLIYEGDIVKLEDKLFTVEWGNNTLCFLLANGDKFALPLGIYLRRNIEVTGNIHELEGQNGTKKRKNRIA